MASSLLVRSLLAHGTKKRGAAVLGDAPHDTATAAGRAAAALAVVDAETVLKAAELAVGAAVIAQRGAAGRNRVLQHRLDGSNEPLGIGRRRAGARRQRRGPAPRRQAGAVERLANVNVAETGHDLLVEQRGRETRRFVGAGLGQTPLSRRAKCAGSGQRRSSRCA